MNVRELNEQALAAWEKELLAAAAKERVTATARVVVLPPHRVQPHQQVVTADGRVIHRQVKKRPRLTGAEAKAWNVTV